MSHLQAAIARTALEKMANSTFFSISTIDSVGEMLRVNPAATHAYRMLRPLHCIHYADMPPEVREAIPGLIRDCFGGLSLKLIV